MKKLLSFVVSALIAAGAIAQPTLQWQITLGGSIDDECRTARQTNDGGYIVAGFTNSTDGDVTGNHGLQDAWIVKLSPEGVLQWQKTFGGSDVDRVSSIRQTNDGGYIVVGSSASTDGDLPDNNGGQDAWVLKLDASGAIQWQAVLGGSGTDGASSIEPTSDGGYIVAGSTASKDGQVTGNHGARDAWVVKLSETGVIQWQKAFGGTLDDFAYCVQQTVDGGYIVGGATLSSNGDVSGNHGMEDFWVLKLNAAGDLQWQKTLGGTRDDELRSISPTLDGGYIMAGLTESTNGDVTGFKGERDCWVVKINETGALQWQKTLGGNYYEEAYSILQLQDGAYVMAGSVYSKDGDVAFNHGARDYWVVRLTDPGVIQWERTFGGMNVEYPTSVQRTSDGGFILAGITASTDSVGDVTNYHGGFWDGWVVKLSGGAVGVESTDGAALPLALMLSPNPSPGAVNCSAPTASAPTLTVDIYHPSGQRARRQTIPNGGRIDLSELPNALYRVVATTPSGQVFYAPLVKQE